MTIYEKTPIIFIKTLYYDKPFELPLTSEDWIMWNGKLPWLRRYSCKKMLLCCHDPKFVVQLQVLTSFHFSLPSKIDSPSQLISKLTFYAKASHISNGKSYFCNQVTLFALPHLTKLVCTFLPFSSPRSSIPQTLSPPFPLLTNDPSLTSSPFSGRQTPHPATIRSSRRTLRRHRPRRHHEIRMDEQHREGLVCELCGTSGVTWVYEFGDGG